jgi:hypothetical protein
MAQKGDAAPQQTARASTLASDAPAPSRQRPAAETMRLYANDWAAFVSWCKAAARVPLPADPDTVTAYLASLADTLNHGTLMRRLAAIASTGSPRPPPIRPGRPFCVRCAKPSPDLHYRHRFPP